MTTTQMTSAAPAIISISNTAHIRNAVITCEIKLFHNYFRGLLQLVNIFRHVKCR